MLSLLVATLLQRRNPSRMDASGEIHRPGWERFPIRIISNERPNTKAPRRFNDVSGHITANMLKRLVAACLKCFRQIRNVGGFSSQPNKRVDFVSVLCCFESDGFIQECGQISRQPNDFQVVEQMQRPDRVPNIFVPSHRCQTVALSHDPRSSGQKFLPAQLVGSAKHAGVSTRKRCLLNHPGSDKPRSC